MMFAVITVTAKSFIIDFFTLECTRRLYANRSKRAKSNADIIVIYLSIYFNIFYPVIAKINTNERNDIKLA